MKKICVFCGSSKGKEDVYVQAARQLGRELVLRGIHLVYGGGNIGLMGVLAEEVMTGGGEVTGIIPNFLVEKELAREHVSAFHVVESMHQRKALMADLSEAFLALPGGFGTLEEFCEMVTWRQLGLHHKPCGLLNLHGFFNPLLTFFDQQVESGFLTSENRALVFHEETPSALLDRLFALSPSQS